MPLPCVPAVEPPVYCDKSTGLFGSGLPPVVEVVEPVPEPEPPKSTGPFGAELPLPPVDEPVADPVPPKSTGPFGVELSLPPVDEPVPDPVPPKSTGPFGVELPLPPVDEPAPEPEPPRSPWHYTRYSFPLTRSVYAS